MPKWGLLERVVLLIPSLNNERTPLKLYCIWTAKLNNKLNAAGVTIEMPISGKEARKWNFDQHYLHIILFLDQGQ